MRIEYHSFADDGGSHAEANSVDEAIGLTSRHSQLVCGCNARSVIGCLLRLLPYCLDFTVSTKF